MRIKAMSKRLRSTTPHVLPANQEKELIRGPFRTDHVCYLGIVSGVGGILGLRLARDAKRERSKDRREKASPQNVRAEKIQKTGRLHPGRRVFIREEGSSGNVREL